MAQRKIVWSHRARIKLYTILEFYAERNKRRAFSRKLYIKINRELSLLLKHPEIGIQTELESVRGLIVDDFILFYEVTSAMIIVHTVWDSRQNPEDLSIKAD